MRFGIVGNLQKQELSDAVHLLIGTLDRVGLHFLLDERIGTLLRKKRGAVNEKRLAQYESCVSDVDMVIALGGDGTILSVARSVGGSSLPILGINLGKLGFLAESAPEEMSDVINDIAAGKYQIEEKAALEATSLSVPEKSLIALNDIVVDKARSSRVIDIEMYINDMFAVTYRGDGLIVSTPTGSTAYALSNGGPIVTPMSKVLGITPISPHTFSGRPLIVPDTDTIRVVVKGGAEEVLISADGQKEAIVHPPVEVLMRKADHPVRLVKRIGRTYFDVLRAKLLWGKDIRLPERQEGS